MKGDICGYDHRMAARAPRSAVRHGARAVRRCASCGRTPRSGEMPPIPGARLLKLCTACGRAEQSPDGSARRRRMVKGFPVQCFVCGRWGLLPVPLGLGVRPEHIVCPACQTRWPKPATLAYPRLRPNHRAEASSSGSPGGAKATLGPLQGFTRRFRRRDSAEPIRL